MASFTYICSNEDCGYEQVLESYGIPQEIPPCVLCESEMRRMIKSAPNVMLNGASAENDYSIPETNAELGLPSEYTLVKDATRSAEEYIQDPDDRSAKRDYDREKERRAKERQRSIDKLRQKYPKFYAQFKDAEKRSLSNVKSRRQQDK